MAVTNQVFRGIEGSVKKVPAQIPELGPTDILLKITHSGLCGTDTAYLPYGIALGHEGVGIVEKVGEAVTQFKVGDRAGGGYLRDACGHCKYCLTGNDIWCYERTVFGEKDYNNGTFADYYIGKETFLHRIPDSLSSEDAAPLMCAGATTYNAIVDVFKPGDRVGVIGIGGLGHLAIQFAAKLGAEVVVWSTTSAKEKEAREFGASEFYLLSELEKVAKPVDILVIAGSNYPDWSKFLNKSVLARAGTIIPLAAPHDKIELPAFPLFFDGYNLHSSLVASRARHDDMLNFVVHNHVKPSIEKFELSEEGMEAALKKLAAGEMRYRGVLVAK